MNTVAISGRLGKDPEIKHLNNDKSVLNFTIAVRHTKEESFWFDCTAWDRTANFIAEHFRKGDGIELEASLRQEKWQNSDGENRSKVVVNVGKASFPLSRPSANNGQQQQSKPQQQTASAGAGFPPADDNLGIDDIPF